MPWYFLTTHTRLLFYILISLFSCPGLHRNHKALSDLLIQGAKTKKGAAGGKGVKAAGGKKGGAVDGEEGGAKKVKSIFCYV